MKEVAHTIYKGHSCEIQEIEKYLNNTKKSCKNGAGEGIRTLDINLGKVALYQLSYTRIESELGHCRDFMISAIQKLLFHFFTFLMNDFTREPIHAPLTLSK